MGYESASLNYASSFNGPFNGGNYVSKLLNSRFTNNGGGEREAEKKTENEEDKEEMEEEEKEARLGKRGVRSQRNKLWRREGAWHSWERAKKF